MQENVMNHGRYGQYDRIVFVDTETDGLRPAQDHIIELAAVAFERSGAAFRPAGEMSVLVRLPEGEALPEVIERITNITSAMLDREGVPEEVALRKFLALLGSGRTLIVGYNAQFDLEMILNAMRRQGDGCEVLLDADYLDPLTAYRIRYPDRDHRLSSALAAYGIDSASSTHRAMDDVKTLIALTEAMSAEDGDGLMACVNVFGYRRKYGLHGERLPGVTYIMQD